MSNLHGDQHDCAGNIEHASGWPYLGCDTLRLLAAPFSSHPDWQPEWSVE